MTSYGSKPPIGVSTDILLSARDLRESSPSFFVFVVRGDAADDGEVAAGGNIDDEFPRSSVLPPSGSVVLIPMDWLLGEDWSE